MTVIHPQKSIPKPKTVSPWPFFKMEGPNKARLFGIAACEQCNAWCEDANAVGGRNTKSHYLFLGMVEHNEPLAGELTLSEELGGICVCEDCYQRECIEEK
jgi:hypothetical protein